MSFDKEKVLDTIAHPVEGAEPFFERMFFNHRVLWLIVLSVATVFLTYQATKLRPEASFENMIPTKHPYIVNYLDHKEDLAGLGNAVRISVETTKGTIFSAEYMEILKQVHDEAFFINGVDRGAMRSLWSSAVRWNEVTEEGFAGGPVVPDDYDGSERAVQQLRVNVLKSGLIGSLVANDFKSAVIYVPLLERDPETGGKLDYQTFSTALEENLRDKFQTDDTKIHITGFAKVVGDLIDGASQVIIFFAVALLITLVMLYGYSRCISSSVIPLLCSVIAVLWQLGLLHTMGMGLDPYSMLVPFLVFAIGVSHGVQIINAIGNHAADGASKLWSARLAFRSLYIPGITALVSDGIGFATLMIIDVAVIQDLAIAASVGVAVIILTNLILLPLIMSYVGVTGGAVHHINKQQESEFTHWKILSKFTRPAVAIPALAIAVVALVGGLKLGQNLKVGDLDPGAPELRQDSRYNKDIAFMTENYAASTDVFVIMVKTPQDKCSSYEALMALDKLQWQLENTKGVQSVSSLVNAEKLVISAMNEGSLKWMSLSRNQQILDNTTFKVPEGNFNANCSLLPVKVFLDDHKAETLTRVVKLVEAFAAEHNTENVEFLMGAGNAGIEAATNIVIKESQGRMLILVYSVVAFLCLLTFRSIKTVLCIITPLALTSILCEALMAEMGIGIKVATLPVIALGVGIGVDYGIYIYSKMQEFLAEGESLTEAYFNTLRTTGKAVAFTGLTLAIGVGTWVFSPIKFQADMGILLTFMFLWNMVGALTLLPAMAWLLGTDKATSKAAVEYGGHTDAK